MDIKIKFSIDLNKQVRGAILASALLLTMLNAALVNAESNSITATPSMKFISSNEAKTSGPEHFVLRFSTKADVARSAIAGGGSSEGFAKMSEHKLAEYSKSIIMDYQQQLGLDDSTNLQMTKQLVGTNGDKHVRFQRTFMGVPVSAMEILVHFDNKANLTSINGSKIELSEEQKAAIVSQHKLGASELSTEAIKEVVSKELSVSVKNIKVLKSKALIVQKAPNLIWQVEVIVNGAMPYKLLLDYAKPSVVVSSQLLIKS